MYMEKAMNLKNLLLVSLLANLVLAGTIAFLTNTFLDIPNTTPAAVIFHDAPAAVPGHGEGTK
jgi:hypothetical protein